MDRADCPWSIPAHRRAALRDKSSRTTARRISFWAFPRATWSGMVASMESAAGAGAPPAPLACVRPVWHGAHGEPLHMSSRDGAAPSVGGGGVSAAPGRKRPIPELLATSNYVPASGRDCRESFRRGEGDSPLLRYRELLDRHLTTPPALVNSPPWMGFVSVERPRAVARCSPKPIRLRAPCGSTSLPRRPAAARRDPGRIRLRPDSRVCPGRLPSRMFGDSLRAPGGLEAGERCERPRRATAVRLRFRAE